MRDYGKVYTAFWTSEDIRGMSEDARTLALYLLTCTHSNMLGCFRLTNAYAADDLQWDLERVSKGFAELLAKGFAYRCERTFWLVIRQYLKWNQFDNPNVGKAAVKVFESLSAPPDVKALLVLALRDFGNHFPAEKLNKIEANLEPYRNPFETVSKPVVVVGAVVVTGTEQEQDSSAPPGTPPKKERRVDDDKRNACRQTWEAYAGAYFDRYGTEPVRNAKVNGQIVNVVDRLGFDEASGVAAFFVSHNNAYYVRDMHSVGTLQKDCEKLRTEWATNTRMTQTRAIQADKTQSNLDVFAPMIAAAKAREEAERNQNAE